MNTLVHGGARTKAIGVIVPVHDEEDLLGHALEAIDQAFFRVGGQGIACRSAIVLDDCNDSSATIAQRRTGSDALLRAWADTDLRHIWLATTDADSRVPYDWLVTQLNAHECGTDLWTGRVVVDDWSHYHQSTARRWSEAYDNEDAPIHGANLGFNALAYVDAGGFTAQATGEDRALYHAIVARGGRTHYDSVVKVVTSGRRHARAPMGFSYALTSVEAGSQAEEMMA